MDICGFCTVEKHIVCWDTDMLVVDYIGIKNNMNKALKRYATGEMDTDSVETIEQSVAMVKDELDILRRMFATFDYSKFTTGTPLEQLDVLNRGAEFAQATKDMENTFMGHTKKLKAAFGLCVIASRFRLRKGRISTISAGCALSSTN